MSQFVGKLGVHIFVKTVQFYGKHFSKRQNKDFNYSYEFLLCHYAFYVQKEELVGASTEKEKALACINQKMGCK